jgi:hypothetical protein
MRGGVVIASVRRYHLKLLGLDVTTDIDAVLSSNSFDKDAAKVYRGRDAADFLRRRALIQGSRFEGLSRIMLFRWGPQGERIDINGRRRR